MTPSEFAFLALGIVIGAAIGAALVEAVRARPAPRREVRITVSPNSITPRRSTTLASADPDAGRGTIPGSPDDDNWLERRLAGETVGPGHVARPGDAPGPNRTRVPSGPVLVPSTAVAVPVTPRLEPAGFGTVSRLVRRSPGGGGASATLARRVAQTAVLDPIAPLAAEEARMTSRSPSARAYARGIARPGPDLVVRPRTSAQPARTALPPTAVAVRVGPDAPVARARNRSADGPAGESGAAASAAGSEACEAERHLVQERCALATAAREQAHRAADALRDGQRAYDTLREQVERAQAIADPREIRAAKDASHRAFRAARGAARTPEAVEAAAREWLNEINRLNTAARDAVHILEAGGAELRTKLPRLERLAVEADAARITAETAEAGCREAREALARCEEQATRVESAAAASGAATGPGEPTAHERGWPTEDEQPLPIGSGGPDDRRGEVAALVRIVRGDRPARDRLIAALAGTDAEATHQWSMRIAGLIDAIQARAIEDGYLDLPGDGFWGLFAEGERRDIVVALSALGFRFDGLGGFADARVPAQRDLSLAVGYAGLDRMRIRNWPRDNELGGLYAGAAVAADEWLADQAGDLSLGRMVDALGARAAELADLWNAWGHVRPALLVTG